MKTAVSIPDTIFEEAEKIAQERGVSRSELYAQALQKIIDEEITRKLNEVYSKEDSSLDPAWRAHVARQLKEVEW